MPDVPYFSASIARHGFWRSSVGISLIGLALGLLGGAITFLFGVAKTHRAVEDANRARGLSRRIITLDLMSRYARSEILLTRCGETALHDARGILTDTRLEGLTKTTRKVNASELIVKMSELTHSFRKRQNLDRAILRAAEIERSLAVDAVQQLAPQDRRTRCVAYQAWIDSTCGEIGRADDGAYAAVGAVYGKYGRNRCTDASSLRR